MPVISEKKELEKTKIEEGVYNAMIDSIDGPVETIYMDVAKQKWIVNYKVLVQDESINLVQYLNNVIYVAESKTTTDSNLVIWLKHLGVFEEFKKNEEHLKDDNNFKKWINDVMTIDKKRLQVVVKNSNKGTDNEYSTVKEITKVFAV